MVQAVSVYSPGYIALRTPVLCGGRIRSAKIQFKRADDDIGRSGVQSSAPEHLTVKN